MDKLDLLALVHKINSIDRLLFQETEVVLAILSWTLFTGLEGDLVLYSTCQTARDSEE